MENEWTMASWGNSTISLPTQDSALTILSGPLLEVDQPGEPSQHLLQMLEISYYVHHGWVLHEYETIPEETYSVF